MATIKLGNANKAKTEVVETVDVETSIAMESAQEVVQPVFETVESGKRRVRSTVREGMLAEDASVLFEETENRGRNLSVYRRNNGTIKQVFSSYPVHYQAEDGAWKEIDNTL